MLFRQRWHTCCSDIGCKRCRNGFNRLAAKKGHSHGCKTNVSKNPAAAGWFGALFGHGAVYLQNQII